MRIKFKNTYSVCVMNPGDYDIEFQLSDYNTFEEFDKELKSHRIKWDKHQGCFNYKGDDEGLFFVISEKDYGATADWCHPELQAYMQKKLYKDWFEDAESVFFAPGLELEDAFNQLKKIDGVELELTCEVNPGDYINQHVGPYQYGKSWNKIKAVCDKHKKVSLKDHVKSAIDNKPRFADEYVNWDDVFNKL